MGNEPERPARHENDQENVTRTATEEAMKEIEEQGHEEDTDTRKGQGTGSGDPISPSPGANEDAVRNDHSE